MIFFTKNEFDAIKIEYREERSGSNLSFLTMMYQYILANSHF